MQFAIRHFAFYIFYDSGPRAKKISSYSLIVYTVLAQYPLGEKVSEHFSSEGYRKTAFLRGQ